MEINSIKSPSFNVLIFSQTRREKFLDFITWIFFRLSLLWDARQREEYHQFFEIKRLSVAENTPEMTKLFKEKVLALCQKISDESITQHMKRLNHGKLGYQLYFNTVGDEKACIKAHEVFEMLSMKWERGVPFNRDRFSAFWPAHKQAIRIENIFLQALAFEKKIPLSTDALEYCRIYDDMSLSFPMSFHSFSLDLESTEKNLTKNIEAMPNDPNEIDDFCDFFSQLLTHWSPRFRIGLCQRYLFSQLSKNYPDKKLYLIILLRALEKDEIYHKYSLETILAKLKVHLQNFNLLEYWREKLIIEDDEFFIRDPICIPFEIHEHYSHLKDSFII
ncbi:hypothetical protein DB42_BN00550 [Neochlamydia sp. EPS4]|uniref:hypothetical protein n=1 Tax=Neochlamydia sp. EPS4 TaxID=1478175 RepID=UPI0005824209|nr:hypothetical protein [Neochlamydia sp. EPS4]KIC73992.1 hypothetical protein DB42_BN00550 [Neochlamydia sp. EPS4]